MRILLGGVPFGCSNLGDEAILTCVVSIVRRCAPPGTQIAVCTGSHLPAAIRLGVEIFPLYGFDERYPAQRFSTVLRGVDFFIWAGATGLSDYPEVGAALLESARKCGVRTIVWGVGMNSKLNPAWYRFGGRKRKITEAVSALIHADFTAFCERIFVARARRKITAALGKCELVVLRDAHSLEQLRAYPYRNIMVGADSAILLENANTEPKLPVASEIIGLCISAQRCIGNLSLFAEWMNRICALRPGALFMMIPMNPDTDFEVLCQLASMMKSPERAILVHLSTPEEVQSAAQKCSLIVSSRLHLLILGLNRLVPGIGIARGSKVEVFLKPFHLKTAGSTDCVDYDLLEAETIRLLEHQQEFRRSAAPVRREMLDRLQSAELRLKAVLTR